MRDSLKGSISELTDFVEGKPTDVEIRTYELEETHDHNEKKLIKSKPKTISSYEDNK